MSTKNSYRGLAPELVRIVKIKAAKAVGKVGIRKQDLPDIEQDLMLALFKGMKHYDSSKCKNTTFASLIIDNRLRWIYRFRTSPAKAPQFNLKTLNIKVEIDEGESIELIDMVKSDGELEKNNSPHPCISTAKGLRIDMNTLLNRMPVIQRNICECLKTMNVTEAAEKLKLSRMTIHRQILAIRKIFMCNDMDGYLRPECYTFHSSCK